MAEGQSTGTYLYAVGSDIPSPEVFGQLTGVKGGKVYTVGDGGLTAVVSDVPKEELRPERKNVAAHQAVLDKAMETTKVVLPVAFGTVADGPDGVRELLGKYHDDLSNQLRQVEGKRQMTTRLVYAGAGNIYEFLVAANPELKEARDTLTSLAESATREDKIELGQRFEEVLAGMRDELADRLEGALRDRCADLKRNTPHSEQELARFVCLVDKDQENSWEDSLKEVAGEFPDFFNLEQGGPYPPYDFVDLHLQA